MTCLNSERSGFIYSVYFWAQGRVSSVLQPCMANEIWQGWPILGNFFIYAGNPNLTPTANQSWKPFIYYEPLLPQMCMSMMDLHVVCPLNRSTYLPTQTDRYHF